MLLRISGCTKWKLSVSTHLCLEKHFFVLIVFAVWLRSQDRGKGERFGLLWEPSPTPGVGEVLWEPTGEQTTNPLHIHPAQLSSKRRGGGGRQRGHTKQFPSLCVWSFTSFLPVEVISVARPSPIGPLSILFWPRTQREWEDKDM